MGRPRGSTVLSLEDQDNVVTLYKERDNVLLEIEQLEDEINKLKVKARGLTYRGIAAKFEVSHDVIQKIIQSDRGNEDEG